MVWPLCQELNGKILQIFSGKLNVEALLCCFRWWLRDFVTGEESSKRPKYWGVVRCSVESLVIISLCHIMGLLIIHKWIYLFYIGSAVLCLPPAPGPWRQYTELGEDTGSTEPSVLCCGWREGAGTLDLLKNKILVLSRLTHFIKNWGWRWRKYGCFCFIF